VKHGVTPTFDPAKLRTVRRIVHLELIALLVLCAALIARGIGYIGA
jgi:putative membrane protein